MTIRPKWDQMNFNGKSIMGIWNLDLAWKNTLQHYPCVDWWKTQDTVGQMIISLRNKSHISSSCVLWDQCQRPLDVPVMRFWWTCSMLVTCVVRVLLPILRKGVMSWIISLSDRYLRVNLCEFSFCARCPGLCICEAGEWDGFDVLVACVFRGKTERKKEEQVRAKWYSSQDQVCAHYKQNNTCLAQSSAAALFQMRAPWPRGSWWWSISALPLPSWPRTFTSRQSNLI